MFGGGVSAEPLLRDPIRHDDDDEDDDDDNDDDYDDDDDDDDDDLHGWHEFTSSKSEEPFSSIETLGQGGGQTDHAEYFVGQICQFWSTFVRMLSIFCV